MNIRRAYYEDSYITRFSASVVEKREENGLDLVILDRTYFYPTSGGQRHDIGRLGGRPVIDVRVGPDGAVEHILASPGPDLRGEVEGVIDWERRFDHMQQHSGQHLLSQAFWQELGLESVSVHFGEEICTVELESEQIEREELDRVEDLVNQIVWADRPIHAYWVDEAKIADLPLRRPPKVSGTIRIVEIEGYDWTACGGTHVKSSGAIGPIALLRTERIRQRVRVHFICGRRAQDDYRRKRSDLAAAANLLGGGERNLVSDIQRLQEQNQKHIRRFERQNKEMLSYRARDLIGDAEDLDGLRLVKRRLLDGDVDTMKGLAQLLQKESKLVILLCSTSGERGTAIFARSDDLDLDVAILLRKVLDEFGGGGGGRPDFAQGGGIDIALCDDLLRRAAQEVGRTISTN